MMNILICITANYMPYAKTMLFSLSKSENTELRIYLFHNDFSPEQIEDFGAFISKCCNGILRDVHVDDSYFVDVPLSEEYSKKIIYYRLLAPYLLPDDIERILYLDSDMIVNKPLTEFYEQSFDDCYAAVCVDSHDREDDVMTRKAELNMDLSYAYFNSGVMLFNLKLIRDTFQLAEFYQYIKENSHNLVWFDQDVLNIFFNTKTKRASQYYNFQVYDGDKPTLEELEQAKILHFVGADKPWMPKYKCVAKFFFNKYYDEIKNLL